MVAGWYFSGNGGRVGSCLGVGEAGSCCRLVAVSELRQVGRSMELEKLGVVAGW